jgi:hypothetical protein
MGKTDLFKFQDYEVIAGNLADGASNTAIDFGDVTTALYVKLNNDNGAALDMTFRIKIGSMSAFGDSITLKAGEELILTEIPIAAIDVSNDSGDTIAYRILIAGN